LLTNGRMVEKQDVCVIAFPRTSSCPAPFPKPYQRFPPFPHNLLSQDLWLKALLQGDWNESSRDIQNSYY
jgi:hypothetical protein